MKIVLATSSFGGGGITSYALELINTYSKGNEFSVIVGDDSKEPITNPEIKKYTYDCKDLSYNNAKNVLHLLNDVIKPELIIASFAPIINIVAPFVSDNIKIITVSHSLRYYESEYSVVNNEYLDKVIAASSEYNKNFLAKRYSIKDSSKIDVIYNFVAEVDNAEQIITKKKRNHPIKIVFAGASSPAKSPEIVLNLMYELSSRDGDFEFYWMGRTHIHMSQHFPFLGLSEISKLGPNDKRFQFLGRLPKREDATNLISSANIFLTPSRREGCPMALLEAMRTGAIPICADFDNANKDIIQDGKCGFVIGSDDISGFADRIMDICKNPHSYDQFYDESFMRFKNNLSFTVWKSNMDNAIYKCPTFHVRRQKSVSSISLLYQILKMKFVKARCWVDNIKGEEIPLLLELYKLKKKYGSSK